MPTTTVEVEPDETAEQLREYVRRNPDVRKSEYQTDTDPILGACYPLSEAYFHATGGTDSGLDIYCLSWADVHDDYDGTHWFLRRTADGTVIDLSLPTPAHGKDTPWDVATRRAFITGYEPSNRCERILTALGLDF